MRILFVNGTAHGGSLLSTHALAQVLVGLGHEAGVLQGRAGSPRQLYLHKRLENLHAKTEASGVLSALAPATGRLVRQPGRRARPVDLGTRIGPGVAAWSAPVTANALGAVIARFLPDVVVVAGVLRPQWRQIHADLRALGLPSVLYLREDALLDHLGSTPAPEVLLANSAALADAARQRGHDATVVPSVVDLCDTLVPSTRQTILVANPLPHYGGDRSIRLAERLPELRFALQVGWPVGSPELDRARRRAASSPNVEVREFTDDRRRVYRDARILLVPYPPRLASARPRVVLEAQANGIPVVASDLPGLRETVGPGGVFVPADAGDDVWASVLRDAQSAARYRELCAAALAHAARPDVDPVALAKLFLSALAERLPEPRRLGR